MSQDIIELQGVKIDDKTIGKFDYNFLANLPVLPPITYIKSPDEHNRANLIDLEEGLYVLEGYFYANGTNTSSTDRGLVLSSPLLATVSAEQNGIKNVSIFSSFGVKFYQIEQAKVTITTKKFEEIEAITNKTDVINKDSTEDQYPTAKAVYDLFSEMGVNSFANINVYYYLNLSTAVEDVNEDNFNNALEEKENSKVLVIRLSKGNYRIILLEDVTETTPIVVSTNTYLDLNGHVLTFSNIKSGESALTYITESGYINGKTSGSKIYGTTAETIKNSTRLIKVQGNLKITGGEYEFVLGDVKPDSSATASVLILYPREETGWDSLSDTERKKLAEEIKAQELINVELDGCRLIGQSSARTVSGLTIISTKCVAKNLEIKTTSSQQMQSCYVVQGAHLTIENSLCLTGSQQEYTTRYLMGIYVIGYATAIVKRMSWDFSEITGNCNAAYLIYSGNNGKIEMEDCILERSDSAHWSTQETLIRCGKNGTLNAKNCVFKGDSLCSAVFLSFSSSEQKQGNPGILFIKDCQISKILCDNWSSFLADSCEIDEIEIRDNLPQDQPINISNTQIAKLTSTEKTETIEFNKGVNCEIMDATSYKGIINQTGELYRYLDEEAQCSGKDLKVYFDYITNSVTKELSTIVDGEV